MQRIIWLVFFSHFDSAGLWSQIKRAPKASIKRNTFETEGPKKAGQESLDKRARQIFLYFKKYNYEVKETGETITFQGTYEASKGQAAALVFYVFCGMSLLNIFSFSWHYDFRNSLQIKSHAHRLQSIVM